MAKVGVVKKDKTSQKRQKEPKLVAKAHAKVLKIPFRRHKNKLIVENKKKTAKKQNGKYIAKKEPKLRCNKNKCLDKISENSTLTTGRKPVFRKNHVMKTDDRVPPVKIPRMVSETCHNSQLVNGSLNASTAFHAVRSPCALKIGIPSHQIKHPPNEVTSNGALSPCSTSAVILSSQKRLLPATGKKSIAISTSLRGKREDLTAKSQHSLKQACKSHENSCKGALKNGISTGTSQPALEPAKKLATKKLKIGKGSKPKLKSQSISPGRQISSLKNKRLPSVKESKPCSKAKPAAHASNQKLSAVGLKPVPQKKKKKPLPVKNELPQEGEITQRAKPRKTSAKKAKCNNSDQKLSDSKAVCVRDPGKLHPQRMASLDAMAKMHVICSSDRRPSVEAPAVGQSTNDLGFGVHHKSSSKKIHVGMKKETREFKEQIIHSRINCVKVEKSVSERTEKVQTFCSISEEKEETVMKRSRGRPKVKLRMTENLTNGKNSDNLQKNAKMPKKTLKRDLTAKDKDSSRKHKVLPEEVFKKKGTDAKFKPLRSKEKMKSEKKAKLKVKETIRMRKTCTYQSVTTVSSHETVDSVVASCSGLGVTTNYETKKTIVRNEACEKKRSLSLEEFQGPFMQTLEVPCSMPQVSNCCNHLLHSSPQALIPLAHSKPCHGFQGARRPNSCLQHCCNGRLPVHQCGHQQPFVYHHVPNDCGCCCSSSLLQPVCDSYVMPSESRACAAQRTHCHISSPSCTLCSHSHGIPPADGSRHHEQHYSSPSASNFHNNWCSCYGSYHDSRCHSQTVCPQCPSASSKQNSLVPCDQTPLDLSMGASASVPVEKPTFQPQTQCPSLHFCKNRAPIQSSANGYSHNRVCSFPQNSCASCWNQNSDFSERERTHQVLLYSEQPVTTDPLPVLSPISPFRSETACEKGRQEIPQGYTNGSAKPERIISRLSLPKKRKFAHGWSWEGEPTERMLALTNDSVPVPKLCYPAMRHREGDIIKERDCVLLKSGPKDTDLPYVAKVVAFWENADDGEMMMSLLWYYRPEHTEQGRKPGQMEDEVFASKHRDVNSVACIEDKCYVLTFNEYCRYRANIAMMDFSATSHTARTVPEGVDGYPRQNCLPMGCVSPDMIFFCRHVYDFRQKRILKNPT